MTIRTRLVFWYTVILTVSLFLISVGTYHEIREQALREKHGKPIEPAMQETTEMVLYTGIPAIVFGLAGGWWLTRRALKPIAALTKAAEQITEQNLAQPLPRTGNGDELDRLGLVLNDMTRRLNDSFHRIREFTLHASHELKTPLTILCGETETALREGSLLPGDRERLASQLDELLRLARIVDGLTLLAKADAGLVQLSMEPVRLDELVRDNFADTQILAEAKHVSVKLVACEEVHVRGDRNRLRQLLLNLADNAVKYNHEHGVITLALRQAGRMAEFSITNTGAGIAPEHLPRVFDRFFRANSGTTPGEEGCGLGLSIAQWIATSHEGQLILASTPGHETTATFRIPGSTV